MNQKNTPAFDQIVGFGLRIFNRAFIFQMFFIKSIFAITNGCNNYFSTRYGLKIKKTKFSKKSGEFKKGAQNLRALKFTYFAILSKDYVSAKC